jgi:CRP-like cAMP-binding protein
MSILQTSKLCQEFEPEEILAFEVLTQSQTAADGDVILELGRPNPSMFVLSEGKVRIERNATSGSLTVAELGPGETFGEMSFLDGSPTSARVVAVGATVMLELSHEMLDELLDERPLLWGKLWRNIALMLKERLLHANELFERHVDLASLDADEPAGKGVRNLFLRGKGS